MQELLDAILKKPAEEAPAGYAFNIRAIPDLFTGETLNIGVAVVAADGSRHARVIEEPGRLECLYGKAAESVVFLAKLAAEAFIAGKDSPSQNVVFDKASPFHHMTANDALDSLFKDQVTVAIPLRQEDEPMDTLSTDQVRAKVYDLLRQKGTPMIVDKIIPQQLQTVVNTARGPKTVKIPLQAESAIGGLESAGYSTTTVRLHLMDALIDLEFAADAWQVGRTGLFIARPELPKRLETRQRLIDNSIDYVVSRAPRSCRVEIEQDMDVLADAILDWAKQKAA